MAAPNTHVGGVPLEEFRKDVPPGWRPGLESYPLKTYFQKLRLWYRITDLPDECVGPLVAGRLGGGAQKIALELKLIRPDGRYDYGDAALVRLSTEQVVDPYDGVTILQHAIPSGVQALCNALREAYGDTDEIQTTRALENFFEHKRTQGQDLRQFSVEWDSRYEEAQLRAGLDINPVAKSYLWLKQSGLSQKHQDDLRLQVLGDMSRFQDIRNLALRLSHRLDPSSKSAGDVFYESYENDENEYYEDQEECYYNDAWWTDEGWMYDEYYQGESWDAWDWECEPDWEHEESPEPTANEIEDHEATDGVYGVGKGKGAGPFGGGCFICGSKWHMAADCPARGKGHGGGSGHQQTKGKSKGWYRPKGKGKKGKSAKGYGKGKGKSKYGKKGGRGPWSSRYYAQQEEQLRHAREGIHIGDSPKKVTVGKTEYFSLPAADHLRAKVEVPVLERSRPSATTTTSSEEAQEEEPGASQKNLHFSFFFRKKGRDTETPSTPRRQGHYEFTEGAEIYHTVAGRRRRGLIIDPGAANGLIGTETLRDLMAHVDQSDKVTKGLVWKEKRSEVTGISGEPDATLGEIQLPLPMLPGLQDAMYTADVVGGNASCCPALVGNPALVRMGAVIATDWFSNHDGLLIIPKKENDAEAKDFHLLRLLYTDSRHYLLPLDETYSAKSEETKAQSFLTSVEQQAQTMWKDVKPKIWYTHGPQHTEQKRNHLSEPTMTQTTTAHHDDLQEQSIELDAEILTSQVPDQSPWLPQSSEAYFDLPCTYPGDQIPEHLPEEKKKKLQRHYVSVKEEFYTKSAKRVVNPDNYDSWKKNRPTRHKVHLWEVCSGSARLSHLALLAGLCVAFPIDYRYGWDIGCHKHQKLILEAQELLDPDVLMVSPSCAPWSIAANRLPAAARARLQQEETTTLQFIKVMMMKQAERGKAFVMEQPWSSAMWTASPLAGLEYEIDGCRPRQRTDQCSFGAVDEKNMPIMKATGLQANMSVRNATRRCQGHRNGHGHLQSSFQGKDKTTMAAVYPHQLCKGIIRDIKKFVARTNEHGYMIYYKCEKCRLGRGAPPGVEHTMVPKECRYGQPAFREPTSSSSASLLPGPHTTSLPARAAVNTPLPQLLEEFREAAMKRKQLDEVKVNMPDNISLTAIESVMLKHLLLSLVEDSVNIISEEKGKHNHWSQDPVHLGVLRKIFSKVMNVKGVCTSLHAETCPLPMPFLRTESAPLRMIIKGDVKLWTVKPAEDIRTYTNAQLNAKIFSEDWVIAVFGSAPQDKDYWEVDRTRHRLQRHHVRPRTGLFTPREDEPPVPVEELLPSRVTTATPYEHPGPKVIIRDEWTSRDSSRAALEKGRWTGTTEFKIAPPDEDEVEEDPVIRRAEQGEEELNQRDEEAEVDELLEQSIDPPRRTNYDFRRFWSDCRSLPEMMWIRLVDFCLDYTNVSGMATSMT